MTADGLQALGELLIAIPEFIASFKEKKEPKTELSKVKFMRETKAKRSANTEKPNIKELIINKERKYFNEKLILNNEIKSSPGVYFLYDKNKNLIYIGQCKNFRQRLLAHVSEHSLRLDRSEQRWSERCVSVIPYGETQYYSFIEILDESERKKLEKEAIVKFNPKYNSLRRKHESS